LEADWKAHQLAGNPAASDEVFVRRVFLDLAGRIPTSAEALAFFQYDQKDKRAGLINMLLKRESYVSTFYPFWADILRLKSNRVNTANVVEAAYEKFVKESLRENKPYDQFVRELLSAKGLAWENGATGYYYRDPGMPLDNMAITARIFLGTRIECAQCHDHPFDKWKQTDFYRLAAYTHSYGESDLMTRTGVRAELDARVKIVNETFKKEKAAASDGGKAAEERKTAALANLNAHEVLGAIRNCFGQLTSPVELHRDAKELKLPHDFKESDGKPFEVVKPAPLPLMGTAAEIKEGSDRAETFAAWVTSPANPRFTKVIVNRLWKRVFGAPVLDVLRRADG